MNLKDVLVFLDVHSSSEERLRLASSLAREHGAKLSAVFVNDGKDPSEYPPGLSMPRRGLVPQLMPSAINMPPSTSSSEKMAQRYRSCVPQAESDWHELDKADPAELVALARTADLVIVGQINPDARTPAICRPEQIVRNCGRPVLMVPYIGSFPEIGRQVLIAWDASRETARAINDALPMIEAADVVTVMTVCDDDRAFARARDGSQRILRHLERHGIAAYLSETVRNGNPVSDVILSRAMDFYVDMIVAGAFNHSPFREALRGGVGRDLLKRMTVPVLMSH